MNDTEPPIALATGEDRLAGGQRRGVGSGQPRGWSIRPGSRFKISVIVIFVIGIFFGGLIGRFTVGFFGLLVVLLYRRRRRALQLTINGDVARSWAHDGAFVLFLRPFSTAGRLWARVATTNVGERLLLGSYWDVELALTASLEPVAPLVAIGHVEGEYGAGKVIAADENWQMVMTDLADRALAIVIVPLNRPSTLWEVRHLCSEESLLQKTMFLMPPTAYRWRDILLRFLRKPISAWWEEARGALAADDIVLPAYRRRGCVFALADGGAPRWSAPLRKMAQHQLLGAFDLVTRKDDEAKRSAALNKLQLLSSIPFAVRLQYGFTRLLGVPFSWAVWGAVVLALAVRTLGYEPFNIPTGSMIPTLMVGDYLFVSKFSYGFSRFSLPLDLPLFSGRILAFHRPQRGDVAVFWNPLAQPVPADFIKRITGLPGDKIQMIHGNLFINDQMIPRRQIEDYVYQEGSQVMVRRQYIESLPRGPGEQPLDHPIIKISDDQPLDNVGPYMVPQGYYFAMGDNRDSSEDSRVASAVGFIPAENLVGPADLLYFSTDGTAQAWEFWQWPFATRWARVFQIVR